MRKAGVFLSGLAADWLETAGLTEYWPFNETAGPTAADKSGLPFRGTIDEVCIYNRSLTDEEIFQLALGVH